MQIFRFPRHILIINAHIQISALWMQFSEEILVTEKGVGDVLFLTLKFPAVASER